MFAIVQDAIDPATVLATVQSPRAGAVVLFLGTVRQFTDDRETAALDYECYQPLAERTLATLEAEARGRWPIVECYLVHRLGRLELGDTAVAVAVSSPHRAAAFEAAQWLMDRIKDVVPIWKREQWADGQSAWVHPGLDNQPTAGGP